MSDSIHQLATIGATDILQTTWVFLQKGGLFMIPLGLTAMAGMTAILYEFLSLTRSRIVPEGLARQVEGIQELMDADRVEPVLAEFEKGHSMLARLSAVAMKHR